MILSYGALEKDCISEKPSNIDIYTRGKGVLNEMWGGDISILILKKSNINSSGKDEKLNLFCDVIRIRRKNPSE